MALVLALSPCVFAFVALGASTPVAWQLEQNSDHLGDCLVFIYHGGAKVVCRKLKCELVCKAPDWRVHCFRRDEKIEWSNEIQKFNGETMTNPFAHCRPPRLEKLTALGTGSKNGLKYTRYRTATSETDVLCTSKAIVAAPQVSEFLSRLFRTPKADGIPIYRCLDHGLDRKVEEAKIGTIKIGVNADQRSGLVTKLETKSWKNLPFNAADFKVPSGFKQSKEIFQVSYSSEKKGDFSEIFDEIGFKTDSRVLKSRTSTR
ncbi:MAG: hypothetical protein Q8T09_12515 [Candidatus Melainabacteria bacterium]|nr:hypothetical protein [Candidatus Melainabacteria bacterium]